MFGDVEIPQGMDENQPDMENQEAPQGGEGNAPQNMENQEAPQGNEGNAPQGGGDKTEGMNNDEQGGKHEEKENN
jgi:hypothetical protein